MRVYLAPVGLWLTLDAGRIERVEFDTVTRAVRVGLARATTSTPVARLRVEQPAAVAGVGRIRAGARAHVERGAYVVPLGRGTTWVDFRAR